MELDQHVIEETSRIITALENSWRSELRSQEAWKDEEPPSTCLALASLRGDYYEGLSLLLLPYLRMVARKRDIQSTFEQTPALLQKVIDVTNRCVDIAIQSIIARDRIGALPDSLYEGYQITRTHRQMLTNDTINA
jgi:hypothetical protein